MLRIFSIISLKSTHTKGGQYRNSEGLGGLKNESKLEGLRVQTEKNFHRQGGIGTFSGTTDSYGTHTN